MNNRDRDAYFANVETILFKNSAQSQWYTIQYNDLDVHIKSLFTLYQGNQLTITDEDGFVYHWKLILNQKQ